MSKCWYCNEELTTANYCDEHIGICTKCYGSMFKASNEFVKGLTDKIVDLEAKLEELNKEPLNCSQLENGMSLCVIQKSRIKELEAKLAEKDEQINKLQTFNKSLNSIKEDMHKRLDLIRTSSKKDYIRNMEQQLADKDAEHELLIDRFEEETENLRKQIKQESDARKRFVEEVKNLKQQLAEKDKAIANWEYMYEGVMQSCHNGIEEDKRLEKLLVESEERYKKAYQEGLLQKQFDKDAEIMQLKEQLEEYKKDNEQLENRLHTAEQETLHFQNKYFDMQQQLAEKDKELLEIKQIIAEKASKEFQEMIDKRENNNQDKISFAVEHLEKAREFCEKELKECDELLKTEFEDDFYIQSVMARESICFDFRRTIDQQIKQLKEQNDV